MRLSTPDGSSGSLFRLSTRSSLPIFVSEFAMQFASLSAPTVTGLYAARSVTLSVCFVAGPNEHGRKLKFVSLVSQKFQDFMIGFIIQWLH